MPNLLKVPIKRSTLPLSSREHALLKPKEHSNSLSNNNRNQVAYLRENPNNSSNQGRRAPHKVIKKASQKRT